MTKELGFDDDLADEPPDYGVYEGFVTDNKDPDGLHRVRVCVPGHVEPASGWARPFGGLWSMSPGSPPKGALVGLGFLGGDRRCPYYLGGPSKKGEDPPTTEKGDPDVRCITDGSLTIQIDSRKGSEGVRIIDHGQGQVIAFERHSRVIRIKAVTALMLQCEGNVTVSGVGVWINKRPVLASPRGIK